MSTARAAIDIGSTSVRLLIVGDVGDLARETTVCRLGDGVDSAGRLDRARAAHTLEVLDGYRALLERHGVSELTVAATSVLRRAGDGDAFLGECERLVGVRPQVLSGRQEGEVAFRGAVGVLGAGTAPYTVVDLGGGSCEFACGGVGDGPPGVFSAEFGAARLTEAYIESDPPRPEELVAALSVIEAHLDDVRRELPEVVDTGTWVGLGGTFTTFAAVELGLVPYDREVVQGFRLDRAAAEDVFRTLVTEPLADRVHNPGLPADRAEVIVGGACAVVAIMRFFALDEIVVSDAGILDGLLAGPLPPG
ncbi:MAG: hypothetical protein OEY23_04555 [Acidimicrobiia bacterium]|nr:hypothetical protein [Acidimicrobiia bacterium]